MARQKCDGADICTNAVAEGASFAWAPGAHHGNAAKTKTAMMCSDAIVANAPRNIRATP